MSTYRITYVAAGHSASDDSVAAIMAVVREEFPGAYHKDGKVYERGDGNRPIAYIEDADTAIFQKGDRVWVTELGEEAIVRKVHDDGDMSLEFSNGDEGSYSSQEVTAIF